MHDLDRSGLADGTFYNLRFDEQGRLRSDFVMNLPAWRHARFLVVGPNFGCGSSREHAVWGLLQIGVCAIFGTSFAGIFFDNCTNNGLLALSLQEDEIAEIMRVAADPARNEIEVNLTDKTITYDSGVITFEIDPLRRERFLAGLDAVAATLLLSQAIHDFETEHFVANPWLQPSVSSGPSSKPIAVKAKNVTVK